MHETVENASIPTSLCYTSFPLITFPAVRPCQIMVKPQYADKSLQIFFFIKWNYLLHNSSIGVSFLFWIIVYFKQASIKYMCYFTERDICISLASIIDFFMTSLICYINEAMCSHCFNPIAYLLAKVMGYQVIRRAITPFCSMAMMCFGIYYITGEMMWLQCIFKCFTGWVMMNDTYAVTH